MHEMLGLMVHPDVYGLRFQLPFFVAWSPIFGLVIAGLEGRWLERLNPRAVICTICENRQRLHGWT